MNVLILGSGGREHALANAIAKSPRLTKLYAAPGNPGTARVAENIALDIAGHAAVIAFAKQAKIDLVIVGPEAPLVAGIVDDLEAAGIAAFGPSKAAAALEGSKGFTKDLCRDFNIPTAPYGRFTSAAAAKAFIRAKGAPIVVKADGLAAGKGVIVAMFATEAEAAVDAMFGGAFGAAGMSVVVEGFLEGEEASFFALCDGERALALGSAQDHKRVGEGDTGPNTGGMGAYSPAPVVTAQVEARIMDQIIMPALQGMEARGAPFRGVLFAGLMIGKDGPQLIEFNARFGDPETQVILPRLKDDLLTLLAQCAAGKLECETIGLTDEALLTVVMAANGYPEAPEKGASIGGIERAEALPGVGVQHAGTSLHDGQLIASGGRVLNVTGRGATIKQAQARAYAGVDALDAPGLFCRRDIGWRAIARDAG